MCKTLKIKAENFVYDKGCATLEVLNVDNIKNLFLGFPLLV